MKYKNIESRVFNQKDLEYIKSMELGLNKRDMKYIEKTSHNYDNIKEK